MKTQPSRRHDGFTLVELLVVIAIIAVLAGAGFAAGNMAVQKAKRVTALATATSLATAVNSFYNDYGSAPTNLTADSDAAEPDLDTIKNPELLDVLLGYETSSTPINLKGIKYFTANDVKKGKKLDGILIENSKATALYDPWGGPFYVRLDVNYNETVTPSPSAGGGLTLNGKRVAVWTDGADFKLPKSKQKTGDDVKTW